MRPLEEIQLEEWRNDLDNCLDRVRQLLTAEVDDEEVISGCMMAIKNYLIDNPLQEEESRGVVEKIAPLLGKKAVCKHARAVFSGETEGQQYRFACPTCESLGYMRWRPIMDLNVYKYLYLANKIEAARGNFPGIAERSLKLKGLINV